MAAKRINFDDVLCDLRSPYERIGWAAYFDGTAENGFPYDLTGSKAQTDWAFGWRLARAASGLRRNARGL